MSDRGADGMKKQGSFIVFFVGVTFMNVKLYKEEIMPRKHLR